MKHLLNTLFFGYLPLGWKRLCRVITFAWWVLEYFLYPYSNEFDKIGVGFIGIGVSMVISYVITGFIKQEKP
jgi:hypothetical protein